MTMGKAPDAASVSDRQPGQEVRQEVRQEVVDLLTQLLDVQKEIANNQNQVVKLLGMLGAQGEQQILDLQNVARHQSLLVENHQALLLQTSRISTALHDLKRPVAPPITAPSQ
ncbi:hypothetical protein CesoFtcFv8_000178 [Champsocephalus esox]|uniref:Uncharacterized protein n=1 Tax=Champsocephalus esox TaxID=159716 RepID=A0AAN8DZV8_9TELE|nr:hypothetical protein CesoFtcFv8_000178 [Champsocephalus esox]